MAEIDAHVAFGKLADETRIEILRVLAAAARDQGATPGAVALSFSELRRGVGLTDSGKFNYHLDQLTGTFLRKTDDGYAFTYAGERVTRTILSGAYGEAVDADADGVDAVGGDVVAVDVVGVDGACPSCGTAALMFRTESVAFVVRCGECEQAVARYPLNPSIVADRDPGDVVATVADRLRASMHATVAGNCEECGGVLDGAVHEADAVPGGSLLYVATCRSCWSPYRLPLALWVFEHPATVSFFRERGVDVAAKPFWELLTYLADGRWVVSTAGGDPAYRIRVRDGDDELRFALDGTPAVVGVEREQP